MGKDGVVHNTRQNVVQPLKGMKLGFVETWMGLEFVLQMMRNFEQLSRNIDESLNLFSVTSSIFPLQ